MPPAPAAERARLPYARAQIPVPGSRRSDLSLRTAGIVAVGVAPLDPTVTTLDDELRALAPGLSPCRLLSGGLGVVQRSCALGAVLLPGPTSVRSRLDDDVLFAPCHAKELPVRRELEHANATAAGTHWRGPTALRPAERRSRSAVRDAPEESTQRHSERPISGVPDRHLGAKSHVDRYAHSGTPFPACREPSFSVHPGAAIAQTTTGESTSASRLAPSGAGV